MSKFDSQDENKEKLVQHHAQNSEIKNPNPTLSKSCLGIVLSAMGVRSQGSQKVTNKGHLGPPRPESRTNGDRGAPAARPCAGDACAPGSASRGGSRSRRVLVRRGCVCPWFVESGVR